MGETKKLRNNGTDAALFFINFILFSLILAMTAYFFTVTFKKYVYTFTSEYKLHQVDSGIKTRPLIVIDPGHGGEDSGASGYDGTYEKDINLKVSQMLYDMLKLAGFNPVMTRTEDILLYDMYSDLKDYAGKMKTYDLRNRLKFTKENEATLFVSIHMNKFSEEYVHGLQVYYSPNNADSKKLAEMIQGYTEKYFQTSNKRPIKKADSSIFLLKRLEIPSVLIECGFLSNREECSLLNDNEYLKKLAATAFCSISEFMQYYTNKG